MIELKVLGGGIGGGEQMVLGIVEKNVSLLDARQIVFDLPESAHQRLGVVKRPLVDQSVGYESGLRQRPAVNFLLHQWARKNHGDEGRDCDDRDDGDGEKKDDLGLQTGRFECHNFASRLLILVPTVAKCNTCDCYASLRNQKA